MSQSSFPVISIFELEKDEFFKNHFPAITYPTLKEGSVYIVRYKLLGSNDSTHAFVDSCGDLVIVKNFTQEHLEQVYQYYDQHSTEKIDLCKWFPKTIQRKVLTSYILACPAIYANQLNAMNMLSPH